MKSLEENMEEMLDIEVSDTPEGGCTTRKANLRMSQRTEKKIMSILGQNSIDS